MHFGRTSRALIFGLLTTLVVGTAVAPAQAKPVVRVKTGSLGFVYFDSGSAKLTSNARITLWRLLPKVNAAATIDVVGYVRESSSVARDRRISNARAKIVSAFFTNRGIAAKVTAKAVRVPANRGTAASARRAEIVITSLKPVVRPTPTPTPTETSEPTPTPSDTESPAPTPTPSDTESPTPTPTPEVLTYTTDGDGNVTVTGCTNTCPADLEIPGTISGNPVTAIGDNAFKNAGLTSVSFPESLLSIGAWAFENNSLTSVTLPDSLTTLSPGALYINSLTSVTVPSSVTSVGDWVFAKNPLTSVVFEGNAPTEGSNVFDSDPDLLAVDVSYGATGWGATFSGVPVNVVGAPSPTPTPSASTGTVSASLTAESLNFVLGSSNPNACSAPEAMLFLTPEGGGDPIVGKSIHGVGNDAVGGLYYDCTFSVELTDVPVGDYSAMIALGNGSGNVGYMVTDSLDVTVSSFASYELDITYIDTVTVSAGSTSTLPSVSVYFAP